MRITVFGAFLAAAASLPAQSTGATQANWPHYGGDYSFWRYSGLTQITRANVAKLATKWVFQTGQVEGGLQTTPIVVDGVMYITTSFNRVYALDAETGREIWRYSYALPKELGVIYGPWSRGVAIGGGRVYMGTLDNSVVALDQKTGREMWKVNVEPLATCGCNITGAPLLAKGKVIVGVTGGDSAHRGYITAFDARTGRKAWQFHTIPGPGEPGNETWSGDSWKYGGGSSWMTGSFDPELNLVYWGVGNPAPDFYGDSRKGANLYTDSVVALDVDSGKLKWYHQQIPHDVWDWDSAYECTLVDLPVNGTMRKLLINGNKGGYTFVVDRTNGEFVAAWPVAKNINWIKGVDAKGNLVGRNEPPVGKTSVICPSIGGGRQWNQGAWSPSTKMYYTTGIEWCEDVTVEKEEPRPGKEYFGGQFKLRAPQEGPAGGHLDAYDPLTGKKAWSISSKYPFLASILATAGDLVFTGDAEGAFFALDARTGQKLWSFQTGSGNRGGPVSYAVKGKQYIATPSGWGSAVAGLMSQLWPEAEHFRPGSAIFVFGLPE
jgi:PQQ-dependent dehydrogenase (methanol/ethanol family)